VVFIAIMVEVTVSLIILSARSHEGSLSSLLVFLGGFHTVQTCWSSPHISRKLVQSYLVAVFDFGTTMGYCYRFHPIMGSRIIVVSANWLGGYQYICFRVDCYLVALFLYQHCAG
jgi:hypothetical protein